ncbi:MAG TPA: hypothetical protein DFS52_25300 [Myxococcales bacterium]|jgi:hypothetical protein|nr:hypothetical protein [Myxococcales bacterium]
MVLSLNWIEIVGYVGSLLIAASLTMSNITKLRWYNLVGALTFAAYGALLQAWPVFAVNFFIAVVDAYYLVRTRRKKDFFTLLPIQGLETFTRKFLLFHRTDVMRFFPGFELEALASRSGFFVLRNMIPAGIVFYEPLPGGDVEIRLDYVVPEYRDQKNAEFVFRILNEQLSAQGHRHLVVRSSVKAHRDYLLAQGFEAEPREQDLFRKVII